MPGSMDDTEEMWVKATTRYSHGYLDWRAVWGDKLQTSLLAPLEKPQEQVVKELAENHDYYTSITEMDQ